MRIMPTPTQLALGKWYLNRVARLPMSANPIAICADGLGAAYVTLSGNLLRKINTLDGSTVWTTATANGPLTVRFDGVVIWVVGYSQNQVRVHRPNDGAMIALIDVGKGPEGLAFDATCAWVTCQITGNLYQIDRATFTVVCTYGLSGMGGGGCGVAYDGRQLWINDENRIGHPPQPMVYRGTLQSNGGLPLSGTPVGAMPIAVTIDAVGDVWVSNGILSVTKVRGSDGVALGTFDVGPQPRNLCADQASIWVAVSALAESGDDTVVRLDLDGNIIATFPCPGTA